MQGLHSRFSSNLLAERKSLLVKMKAGRRHFVGRPFLKFISLVVFLWILILTYMATNSNFSKVVDQKFYDIDVENIIQNKIARVVEMDFAEGTDDDDVMYVADESESESDITSTLTTTVSVATKIKSAPGTDVPKPTLPPAIRGFHRRLNLTNPGHLGAAVELPKKLPRDIELMVNRSRTLYQINEFITTLVPLDRELPDYRTPYCKGKKYSERLPVASVITVFHNEPLSMILRTVYSVLNRTPAHLLKEIILVDDCSFYRKTFKWNSSQKIIFCAAENLKQELKEHLAKLPKVRLIRSPTRIGLIKARMVGAVNAAGPGLFSHFA